MIHIDANFSKYFQNSHVVVVLTGVSGLIIPNVGPVALAQETENKQIDEAMKALDSGDNAAAEGYLLEANQTLTAEVGEAMKALQAGNVTGAMTPVQAVQGGL